MSPKIAELIGAHCGDGTLYKTTRGLVWELRGELTEKDYYVNNICPLLKEIFTIEIISKFRSGGAHGCWGVQTSNQKITTFFLRSGFVPGTKTFTVSVPSYILNSTVDVKRAFVRGLFDTDGCLRFDRINNREKCEYPRVEFGFVSKSLRDGLKLLLDDLGFTSFLWRDRTNYKLCLSGRCMLEKWMKEIQPKNPKHLKKYGFWKSNGFYLPKTRV